MAGREESLVPRTLGWVCGPTFKILEDSTMPTLLRLIPPDWVDNWVQDNLTLTLKNGSVIAFRSLDDPERGRGQGPHWAWFDETTLMVERAWDVFRPSLTENLGPAFFTMSPAGYDWCYDRLWKPAMITKRPGFWSCKYKTSDNPLFKSGPLQKEIEEARLTMPHDLFRQEYEADFVNFTGSVYGDMFERNIVWSDDTTRLRKALPECVSEGGIVNFNNLRRDRLILVGLDSGADHPFGAVMIVVGDGALVMIDEYLERHQAMTQHLDNIRRKFALSRFSNVRWSANKNEAQLRLEFGLRGTGVIQAENNHQVGIQRVQSWFHLNQLIIYGTTCPKAVEQFRAYRYADNFGLDGQKREREQVYKKEDELPDATRYAVMAWPELPTISTEKSEREKIRWASYDDKTRDDIERMREHERKHKNADLPETDKHYPVGDFFSGDGEADDSFAAAIRGW